MPSSAPPRSSAPPASEPPSPSEPPAIAEPPARGELYSQPPPIDEDLFSEAPLAASHDEVDADEESEDRPTLLLPDEPMMAEMARANVAADEDDGATPRNASARIVMSRTEWIKLADPGLTSLPGDQGQDVRALVTLLEPSTPTS